ncbi:hypothetical protein K493DRAFT_382825 [Basidiobolus meristosporus CBS 931.73]|uniref:Uncharacterized protein n=1 Tax=Basidiobolus meristosporus CBS 931.73 TaxID=1314790 RepID=A0A1Y1XUH5_9FUNG|nr:hypothetical protein K493DRAFT_382825 [Basidiobolus meristosporus CBS 931.73]|eukprot:ORX89409.1 hypothetical protein K493DRAFT_382825 [Basidiobolus meristosporus CBS 931.73]
MIKFFKSKPSKNASSAVTSTDGMREDINEIVDTMDQGALISIVDSRYPSDSMKEACQRSRWRNSYSAPGCTLAKRSSIASSSASISSSSSEESVLHMRNGVQWVVSRNKRNNQLEVRVFHDGQALRPHETMYHLSLARKYQQFLNQH